jgi:chromosomal replication initiator protein
MRLAILQKKAQIMGVQLPEEIMNFLANRIRANIRRLEGALIRVASYAALTGKKMTLEVVEGLLREILHEEGRYSINIDVIQKKVAEHFDIRLADMTSKRRPENIAFPRQVAMFLSRQMTETSLSAIGEAFGGRDHGTVLHACRLVKTAWRSMPTSARSLATSKNSSRAERAAPATKGARMQSRWPEPRAGATPLRQAPCERSQPLSPRSFRLCALAPLR